jgi:hypothetical protein
VLQSLANDIDPNLEKEKGNKESSKMMEGIKGEVELRGWLATCGNLHEIGVGKPVSFGQAFLSPFSAGFFKF